jgi:hypothetical protein
VVSAPSTARKLATLGPVTMACPEAFTVTVKFLTEVDV